MKNKLISLLLVSSLLPLVSCNSSTSVSLSSYIKEVEMENEYRILQLADIHYNSTTDVVNVEKYLSTLFKESNPDLIVLSGDQFMLASKGLVKRFYSFFESLSIPYAVIWGNHDIQGDYSFSWLSEYTLSQKNAIYFDLDDSVDGRSNYIININKNNSLFYQLYFFDTGNDTHINGKTTYDYIHDSQVEWYKNEVNSLSTKVNNMAFFHIPLWEVALSYYENNESKTGNILGKINTESKYKMEGLTNNKNPLPMLVQGKHSSFFSVGKENNLRACFFAHDHLNDYVSKYEDIVLGYGVKSSPEINYCKKDGNNVLYDRIGASIVSIKEDASFSIDHIFISYDEVKEGQYTTYKTSSTFKGELK